MLPHVAFRPVTMVRCPMGQETKCFYQRHAGSGVPEQLREVTIPGFDEPYLYHRRRRRAGRDGPDGGARDPSLGRHGSSGPTAPTASSSTSTRPRASASRRVIAAAQRGARAARGARPRRASSRRPAARASTSSSRSRRRHDWQEVKSFAKGVSAQMAADSPGPLSDHRLAKADRRRPDLHRLSAQRPDLDRGRALLDPLAQGRPGGDADPLGRR